MFVIRARHRLFINLTLGRTSEKHAFFPSHSENSEPGRARTQKGERKRNVINNSVAIMKSLGRDFSKGLTIARDVPNAAG